MQDDSPQPPEGVPPPVQPSPDEDVGEVSPNQSVVENGDTPFGHLSKAYRIVLSRCSYAARMRYDRFLKFRDNECLTDRRLLELLTTITDSQAILDNREPIIQRVQELEHLLRVEVEKLAQAYRNKDYALAAATKRVAEIYQYEIYKKAMIANRLNRRCMEKYTESIRWRSDKKRVRKKKVPLPPEESGQQRSEDGQEKANPN